MGGRTAVVIGGGIGGLATALALHQRGWRVHVLERAPEFTDIGAGLSLWPNAMRALDVLGLANQIRVKAAAESGGGVRDRHGRWLSRADNDEIARRYGWPMLLVHRADLVQVLADAVPVEALYAGCPMEAVQVNGDSLAVRYPGGTLRADLVVGADGIHSAVRRQWWPQAPAPRYLGYAAWRMITRPVPESIGDGAVYWGRGERIGFTAMPGGRYYVFAAVSGPSGGGTDPTEFRKRFADWPQPIPLLLDTVDDDQMLRHDVYDLAEQPTYARDRVALVGDAAHAMDPFLGQGACQALEDAVTLAACLEQCADLEAALADYDRARRPRTRAIVRRARRLGAVAQWSWPTAVFARDLVASWLPRNAALRGVDEILSWTPPTPGGLSSRPVATFGQPAAS